MEYTVEQGFRQYKRLLGSMVLKFLNYDSVDDILQEFFYIALVKQGSFRSSGDFLSYAKVCIRNMCITVLRFKKKYRIIDTSTFSPEWFPTSEEAGVGYEDDILRSRVAMLIAVEDAMNGLTPRGKQVMRLTFSGLMPADIAKRLNLRLQTVKNQRTTASNAIRRHIREKRDELKALVDKKRVIREIEIDKRVTAIMEGRGRGRWPKEGQEGALKREIERIIPVEDMTQVIG